MKTRSSVITSIVLLLFALSILIIGLLSVFVARADVPTHLSAGTMNLRLDRLGLAVCEPDGSGVLTRRAYGSYDPEHPEYGGRPVAHHYRDKDTEDVFMLDGSVPMVPGAYREAQMRIAHEAYDRAEGKTHEDYKETYGRDGNVPFAYWIEISLSDKEGDGGRQALAERILVEIETSDDEGETYAPAFPDGESAHTFSRLSEDRAVLTLGGPDRPVGKVTGGEQYFRVRLTFVSEEYTPVQAQGKEIRFDLTVHAVQIPKP